MAMIKKKDSVRNRDAICKALDSVFSVAVLPFAIYACCADKHHFTNCASCERIPCEIWQAVRDPSMTDEQFRKSIGDRVGALKNCGRRGR